MAELLLHSLSEFDEVIFAAIERLQPRGILEIGSETGAFSARLLAHCEKHGVPLTVIEPHPTDGLVQTAMEKDIIELAMCSSEEYLADRGCAADFVLIDGDHNYHTVAEELRLIHRSWAARGVRGTIFLHDVGWPWGRRDLYYAPDRIPAERRLPHSFDLGVTVHSPQAIAGGFRGMGAFAVALDEGGERNGVLTAVEDFGRAHPGEYTYRSIDAVFGLGALSPKGSVADEVIAEVFAPYDNALVRRLERNRLELYLKVIELQDLIAAKVAQ